MAKYRAQLLDLSDLNLNKKAVSDAFTTKATRVNCAR